MLPMCLTKTQEVARSDTTNPETQSSRANHWAQFIQYLSRRIGWHIPETNQAGRQIVRLYQIRN